MTRSLSRRALHAKPGTKNMNKNGLQRFTDGREKL